MLLQASKLLLCAFQSEELGPCGHSMVNTGTIPLSSRITSLLTGMADPLECGQNTQQQNTHSVMQNASPRMPAVGPC